MKIFYNLGPVQKSLSGFTSLLREISWHHLDAATDQRKRSQT